MIARRTAYKFYRVPGQDHRHGCFTNGADTGSGKTVAVAAIVARLQQLRVPARPVKLLITGLDEPPDPTWPPDHEQYARANGTEPA